MGQRPAQPWLPVLLPVLLAARRPRGDAPTRALTALAPRLGVAETAAAPAVVLPAAVSISGPAPPLVPMTGPNGASSVPKTLWHRQRGSAASTATTPEKMSWWSLPCFASSCAVTPPAAASRTSAWPTRHRLRSLLAGGWGRLWASWRSRCPRSRSSCPPSNPGVRSARWRSNARTRPYTSAGSAWRRATGASSAGASATTASD